jgi:hypothetical protein
MLEVPKTCRPKAIVSEQQFEFSVTSAKEPGLIRHKTFAMWRRF